MNKTTVSRAATILEARGLRSDTPGENPEYMRGMCELIARCFPDDTDTSTQAQAVLALIESGTE